MAADPLEALLDLVPHVRVLEHQPGRLKLRFSLSGLAAFEGAGLDELIRIVPGIRNTRAGLLTRTLRIDYDPESIGYDVWEDILSVRDDPERRPVVLKRLRETVERAESG